MTDSFEKWINGMNEDMYEDWLEDTATDLQQEKALNIRTPLNESETEDIEAEQTFEQPSRVVEVYDNRDLPPIRRNVTIEQYYGQPPIIIPQTPVEESRIVLPRVGQAPTLPKPIIQPQRTTIRQRFASFGSRITSLFRRRKQ